MNEMVFAQMRGHREKPHWSLESSPKDVRHFWLVEINDFGYIMSISFCVPEKVLDGTSPHAIVNLVGVHSSFLVELMQKKKKNLITNPIEDLVRPNVKFMYLEEFKARCYFFLLIV